MEGESTEGRFKWIARAVSPDHAGPTCMVPRIAAIARRSGRVKFISRPKSRNVRAKRKKRSRANSSNEGAQISSELESARAKSLDGGDLELWWRFRAAGADGPGCLLLLCLWLTCESFCPTRMRLRMGDGEARVVPEFKHLNSMLSKNFDDSQCNHHGQNQISADSIHQAAEGYY
jgi:hypothetical protein